MPTPLEVLMDPVSLTIIAIYALLFIFESIFPGRKLPKMRFWKIRGIALFAFFFYLSTYLPLLTYEFLSQYQLIDLSGIHTIFGTLIGILLYEFGVYVWHRAMHKSNFLWKTFHQMHHSVERIDIPSTYFFSPLDMIGWTVLGSLCFALLVGLSPQAITITLLATNFLAMFQHANIKTPHWLGYIVQRPESHTLHHAKDIHAFNYSDLPLFDIIFGTFRNPKGFDHEVGFYRGASSKIWKMLTFQDVSEPPAKVKS